MPDDVLMHKKINFLFLLMAILLNSAFSCSSKQTVKNGQNDKQVQRTPDSAKESAENEKSFAESFEETFDENIEDDLSSLYQTWYDRGVLAKENIDRIRHNMNLQDLCIKDFERSFYFHSLKAHQSLTRAKVNDGTVYSLNIIHSSDRLNEVGGLKVTLINFYYDNKDHLVKVDIPLLARGWRVQMSSKKPRGFVIDNSRCYYFININNPFKSGVISVTDRKEI